MQSLLNLCTICGHHPDCSLPLPTRLPALPAAAARRLLATQNEPPYVCIRPLEWEFFSLAVHCYVQSGSSKTPAWSSAFDDTGVHAEVNPGHFWRTCVPLKGATLSTLQTAQWSQIRTGQWDGADYDFDDHNCCHYVDAVIRQAGSPGVTSYFPGYDFPPDFPW